MTQYLGLRDYQNVRFAVMQSFKEISYPCAQTPNVEDYNPEVGTLGT
jgi:hypothetical protein